MIDVNNLIEFIEDSIEEWKEQYETGNFEDIEIDATIETYETILAKIKEMGNK
jgi:hypothetical protein